MSLVSLGFAAVLCLIGLAAGAVVLARQQHASLRGLRWVTAAGLFAVSVPFVWPEVFTGVARAALSDPYEVARWQFVGAQLEGATLTGDMRGYSFFRANMDGVNFAPPADLRDAKFIQAQLAEAQMSHLDMSGADFDGANLVGASLQAANLRGASFHGAVLSGADLRGADLSDSDFTGARLQGANLQGAAMDGAAGLNEDVVSRFHGASSDKEVASRIDALEHRLTQVESRLAGVQDSVTTLVDSTDSVRDRIGKTEDKLATIESRQSDGLNSVSTVSTEVRIVRARLDRVGHEQAVADGASLDAVIRALNKLRDTLGGAAPEDP